MNYDDHMFRMSRVEAKLVIEALRFATGAMEAIEGESGFRFADAYALADRLEIANAVSELEPASDLTSGDSENIPGDLNVFHEIAQRANLQRLANNGQTLDGQESRQLNSRIPELNLQHPRSVPNTAIACFFPLTPAQDCEEPCVGAIDGVPYCQEHLDLLRGGAA